MHTNTKICIAIQFDTFMVIGSFVLTHDRLEKNNTVLNRTFNIDPASGIMFVITYVSDNGAISILNSCMRRPSQYG